ncbi:Pam17-domain-containing protein [Nadsonia fulvescens var. elongata DSM 6958]|uniref:Presequence translocated-associated motor subunit PAM17 n=1 Tax=Nadsonia fulvescens var. elongata DSM 6958 TaxID=857566 RepID=A0A1E3PE01_9ASCO|nr:Pam17-domain-containing protein [Nadsonia fulvescens var. elongata DSM 6958]
MILPHLIKLTKTPTSLNLFRSSFARNGANFGLLNRLPMALTCQAGNRGLVMTTRSTMVSSKMGSIRLFSSKTQLSNNAKSATDSAAIVKSSNAITTWPEFFAYRVQIRRSSVLASILSGLVGGLMGWSYIGMIEIDPTKEIMGFDPFMVHGAGLVVAICFCSMFGPSINDVCLRLFQNTKYKQYQIKNSQFLKRIAKNRVDPSLQSLSNPVPDYYGEKINSLKEYRGWLRDCNTHRRKRQTEA